ncbi:O-antigen ligase [Marinilabiliaceae bacterium ANBcel2]|nr:O-antigen ligase [Marinilabiliaceae bacterium ANBcel2]
MQREVSVELNIYHPAAILVAGHIFYLLLFIAAPLNVVVPPSWESLYVYFAASFLLFTFLSFTVKLPLVRKVNFKISYDKRVVNRILWVAIFIISVGVLFRLVDRFVYRDLSLLMSSYERKELIESSDSSVFSIISAFVFPAGLFIYPLCRILQPDSRLLKYSALLLFIYPSFDVILTGNRGVMVMTLALYFMIMLVFNEFNHNRKKIIFFGLVFITAFSLSLYVIVNRITSFGFDPGYSANYSGYAYTAKPNEQASKALKSDDFMGVMTFGYVNFCQYYLHGVLEWGYLYDKFEAGNHQNGRASFAVVHKFYETIVGVSSNDDEVRRAFPRSGVYTTFLGPFFVDFGYGMFLLIIVLGVIIRALWRALIKGAIIVFPIYLYFCGVLFFYPVVNFIRNALGLYIIVSFICITPLLLYLYNKIVITNEGIKSVK